MSLSLSVSVSVCGCYLQHQQYSLSLSLSWQQNLHFHFVERVSGMRANECKWNHFHDSDISTHRKYLWKYWKKCNKNCFRLLAFLLFLCISLPSDGASALGIAHCHLNIHTAESRWEPTTILVQWQNAFIFTVMSDKRPGGDGGERNAEIKYQIEDTRNRIFFTLKFHFGAARTTISRLQHAILKTYRIVLQRLQFENRNSKVASQWMYISNQIRLMVRKSFCLSAEHRRATIITAIIRSEK